MTILAFTVEGGDFVKPGRSLASEMNDWVMNENCDTFLFHDARIRDFHFCVRIW